MKYKVRYTSNFKRQTFTENLGEDKYWNSKEAAQKTADGLNKYARENDLLPRRARVVKVNG